jgi:hypothetical protein
MNVTDASFDGQLITKHATTLSAPHTSSKAMATLSCALSLVFCRTAAAYWVAPRIPQQYPAAARCAVGYPVMDEGGGGGLSANINPDDLDRLKRRIQNIQENGLATPAQKLFDMAMSQPPQALMREFFRTGDPMVIQAMQDAVAALLGNLPPYEFDAQMTTTGDKLAALMLQLQMTGYLLRNAEYVMKLRQILQIKSRSADDYRKAFDRVDQNGSGYIEGGEVEQLLRDVYGDDVPTVEVDAFLQLFDTDGDGRISFDEFTATLGALNTSSGSGLPSLGASEGAAAPSPKLSGTVSVLMDDGSTVEMDANEYMEQLKTEADALRAELMKTEQSKQQEELSISSSISSYVASLPEAQLQLLTSGISEDVVAAMKQLVTYILRAPNGNEPLARDAEVTLEQAKLQQLCLYQLILGYRLREAEATGEANEQIGR